VRATFPKYLRNPFKPDPCNIANRPDGNNFQLESFPRYNNNTMKNEDDVFGNSIVWCEHKNSKKSKKHSSSLANPSLGRNQQVVVDSVNGSVMKGTEHRKPSEVKIVVRLGGKLMLGHAASRGADFGTPLKGAHNAMAMVDVPKCVEGLAESIIVWNRGAGVETNDGNLSLPPPLAFPPESPTAPDVTSNARQRPTRKRQQTSRASPPTPAGTPPTPKKYQDGFVEPLILHVPLEDGPLRTVCLKPGNLSTKPINFNLNLIPPSSHEDPDDPAIQASYSCAVCKTTDSSESKMYKCFLCGLVAHQDCCYDEGMITGTGKRKRWICSVCNVAKTNNSSAPPPDMSSSTEGTTSSSPTPEQQSITPRPVRTARLLKNPNSKDASSSPDNSLSSDWKRPLHPCVMCHHVGGPMSPTPDNKWVHEGCRIFCYQVERKSTTCDKEMCALCGLFDTIRDPDAVTKRGLVRCCAKDCTVTFHPTCAEIYNAKVVQATKEFVKQETLVHEEGESV
jgi:hypothetical protein